MNAVSEVLRRTFYGVLILALVALPELATAQQTTATDQPQAQPSAAQQQQTNQPAQPATTTAPTENTQQSQQVQSQPSELPNSPGSVRPQTQPSTTERPLGTAAAEIGNASGTAASKPAGVAIAPAKQHQSRSLLIKLGAVLGAGVAIGTVMALSNASPSRPPNSQ
jgi:cytoskeletal protein RodZ